MKIFAAGNGKEWLERGLVTHWGVCAVCRPGADTLRLLATQQMAAGQEQIGQCAGYQQAVGVLREPAIAHLGEAEHPLHDPDRMFDPGPHFRLGTVFRPLGLIDDAAVAVAPVDEILGLRGMLTNHRPLAAIGLTPPTRVSFPCNSSGSTVLSATLAGVATTAWISLLRLSTPKCPFMPKYHWLPFFV